MDSLMGNGLMFKCVLRVRLWRLTVLWIASIDSVTPP